MYDARYDELERSVTTNGCSWNLLDTILALATPRATLVDIGCGTAAKLLPLVRAFTHIWGVEPNAAMRARAMERLAAAEVRNVRIIEGEASLLPLPSESCDVATVMLAPHDAAELHRVLKPGGWAVVEKLGELDKREVRLAFGRDACGLRGRRLDGPFGHVERAWAEQLRAHFDEVQVRDCVWDVVLSREGLDLLLAQTPMVRDFDPQRDRAILDELVARVGCAGGLRVVEHRYLLLARKSQPSQA